MRSVVCAVCGGESKEVIEDQKFEDSYLNLISPDYQKTGRFLVRCKECSFVFHDPQLDADDTEILYRKFRDFSPLNETPDEYFDRITSLPKSESENQQKLSWIDSALPALKTKAGRLLDVGCGGGVSSSLFFSIIPDGRRAVSSRRLALPSSRSAGWAFPSWRRATNPSLFRA